MTIEELKDEFARYLYIDSVDYYSKEPLTERKLLQIWLDCAEPREKKIQNLKEENEQLKQQIEEMKNCYNCSNFCDRNVDCSSICVRNNPTVKQLKDYWKMKDIY